MEKRGHREKFWAAALFIAIVIVLSGMCGTLLLQKESSTGGMEVLWKQTDAGTDHGQYNIYWTEDLAIVNYINDKELRCIRSDGSVAWSHPCTDISRLVVENGRICYVDRGEGVTLTCLDYNGSVVWSLPDPWANETPFPGSLTYGVPEVDGNTYIFSSTARSVQSVDGAGSERWTFSVDNGVIGSLVVYSDGTVFINHIITNVTSLNSGRPQLGNGEEIIGRELILISPNGTVRDKLEIPGFMSGTSRYFEPAANGTLIFSTYDPVNQTSCVIGVSDTLQIIWSANYTDVNGPVQGKGSIIYYLEHHSVKIDPYGNFQQLTTLCAYNTSNGSYLFRTDFSGTFSGDIIVNGDTAFVFSSNLFCAVGLDGQARNISTSDWGVYGAYGNGLLMYDDIGLKLIGPDGSTQWQYDLYGGVIRSVHVASDGTIMVWANDGFTAIHKPTMSTNMMYLVGLVTFDLLIILIAGVWILGRRSPIERKTP